MKLNGEDVEVVGVIVPPPSSVIVTLVALPPKVLPLNVTAVTPQVFPAVDPSVRRGGLIHPQLTENKVPVVAHPEEFRTVMV